MKMLMSRILLSTIKMQLSRECDKNKEIDKPVRDFSRYEGFFLELFFFSFFHFFFLSVLGIEFKYII